MQPTLRVMTFNLRRSECADGDNRWEIRSPHVVEWLHEQQPHIVGFQEVMPDASEFLDEHLPGYEWAGCGRSVTLGDEHCRIAWRGEGFAVIRQETFWLSDTPYIPGSKFAGGTAFWPRICTLAELYDKADDRRFRIYNTHLDYDCQYSKEAGIRVLMEHIARDFAADPLPFLLMGDFNSTPDSDVVQQVFRTTPVPLTDLSAVDALPLSYTYHGYGLDTPCKIDYLLGTPEWKPEGQKLGTWHHNGVFLSDHFPVVAELLLK